MLEKNDLAGDSLKIVPRQYLPLISRGELLRKETFGSTGKCLEVYWSKEDYMRSMYSLWYYRKKYYGVTPDISTFAKAIASGYPFGAVVGKKKIMECSLKILPHRFRVEAGNGKTFKNCLRSAQR